MCNSIVVDETTLNVQNLFTNKGVILGDEDIQNICSYAIGEVNGDRSNYKYGANRVTKGQYGNCEVQVDFKAKRAYVKDDIKGDIARTYFYMSDKYKVRLSKKEKQMFNAWSKQDPVNEWERVKNKRIEKLQGNLNPYIQ